MNLIAPFLTRSLIRSFHWLFSLSALIATGCSSTPESAAQKPDSCKVVRGAFDIGSGSTKAKVALVDHCRKIIAAQLFEESERLSYSSDLVAHQGSLSPSVRVEGLRILKNLRTNAEAEVRVKQALRLTGQTSVPWSGFATSAFRQAANGKDVISGYSESLSVPLKVIPHEKEAELGYASGRLTFPDSTPSVVVWDIGGGSQQIVYREPDGTLKQTLLEGKASNGFKNHVVQKVLKKDPDTVTSPNPIGTRNAARALHALKSFIPEKIALPLNPQVTGIGGVFQIALPKMTGNPTEITRPALDAAIRKHATATDAELNDKYAATLVTNLILVRGMMEKMGLHSVVVSPYQIIDSYLLRDLP